MIPTPGIKHYRAHGIDIVGNLLAFWPVFGDPYTWVDNNGKQYTRDGNHLLDPIDGDPMEFYQQDCHVHMRGAFKTRTQMIDFVMTMNIVRPDLANRVINRLAGLSHCGHHWLTTGKPGRAWTHANVAGIEEFIESEHARYDRIRPALVSLNEPLQHISPKTKGYAL